MICIKKFVIILAMVKRKFNKKKKNSNTRNVVQTSRYNEKKYVDLVVNFTILTTPVQYFLIPVAQGVNFDQRIGLSIKPLSLDFRAILKAGTALVGNTVVSIRIIIYMDRQQATSTIPTASQVINPVSPTGQRTVAFIPKYKIIGDNVYKVDIYNPTVNIKQVFKLGFISRYFANGAGDISTKGIFMMFVCDNLTNPPTADFFTRVTYSD